MASDAPGCLARVAEAGYDTVELVGYGSAGFPAIIDGLTAAGLRAVSQHVPYRRLEDELEPVIAENTALGCRFVVLQQGRHQDWVDADAVRSFAATCNRWGDELGAAGLRFGHHGYHEMDLEFAPEAGRTRWDIFVEETDPDRVFLQLDTYWVRRSGNDPVELLRRLAGRTPLMHLKDTSPDAGGTDTTVGDGLMDLAAVLEAAVETGVQAVIVEQEGDPPNALRDAAVSRRHLAVTMAGLA